MEDYKKQLKQYNKLIAKEPENAQLYNERADIKQKLGDFFGAVDDYNMVIELSAEDYLTYQQRGICCSKLRYYSDAFEDFTQSLMMNTDVPETYFQRAMASHEMGNKFAACNDWQRASAFGHKEAIEMQKQHCKPTKSPFSIFWGTN